MIKPFTITVDKDRIFITEGPHIYIYSSKDLTFQRKFGKEGEGPEEFKLMPEFSGQLDVHPDGILVTSIGKISFFTRNGEFKWEKRYTGYGGIMLHRTMGQQLIGVRLLRADDTLYKVVNIYNSDMEKIKEINRCKYSFQFGQFNPITRGIYIPNFYIYDSKIFVGGEIDSGLIHVFNKDGNKLFTVKPKLDKVKFTEADKQGWIDSNTSNSEYKRDYERMKNRFKYPKFFPLWQNFVVADKKIYIQTFKRNKENTKNEIFIMDIKGKLVKKTWLPFSEYFDFTPSPYTINNGKIYQLVENEDTEEWELHITEIK